MSDRDTPDEMQALRDALVLAALPHVPFDGWSMAALKAAAESAGHPASMAERAFPKGPVQAVEHFAELADRLLEADALQAGLEEKRLAERMLLLVKLRLSRWAEHREAIRRAVSLLTLPANAPVALRMTWRTVDSLWHAVNDQSADFSYYTKRASLAAVYSSTLLYWLEDQSDDFSESWAFLERRLVDLTRLPKWKSDISKQLQNLPNPLMLLTLRAGKAKRRFGVRN
ncbi:MAG TPA: COQ9 family protein [Candidatus Sulfotelmatobacter sp.]|jgi:ubiquinone biosynthesis protein COQ9|nr:COQ9 family protein [Candidatus Sulfotelmatobacter sp.]